MSPDSPSRDDSELLRALDDEAKRLVVDALYTGRGHQAAGRRWAKWNHWLGVPAAVLTTVLTGGAGLSAVIDRLVVITAVLAFLAAAASSARGFLEPGEKAEAHALKGNRFIALRNDARRFREVEQRLGLSPDELASRLTKLRRRYAELNEVPPLHVPEQDNQAAKRSIEAGESNYENDPIWKELST